jgi:hypothetical protein
MCYIKIKSGFIRAVALGVGLLFVLISMPAAGYALDTIIHRGLALNWPYSWPYFDSQPVCQVSYLPDDNLQAQDDLSVHLLQETNYRFLAEMPIPQPALGAVVAMVSFPVEDAVDYHYWRDRSREAWREIKESVVRESTAAIIKNAGKY